MTDQPAADPAAPGLAGPDAAAPGGDDRSADVIVVGAGPGGSTTAYYLAQSGLDVLLLEKSAFPREKVCGDGLTPRAVRQLVRMGVDISPEAGWFRHVGLRLVAAGSRLEIPWPELSAFPSYGLVRTRLDFDEILARHAVKAGVRLLERVTVTAPVTDDRTGRVTGVRARAAAGGPELTFRAPLIVAADGNSSRFALALGLPKRDDRPLGVAVRTYYRSPRHDDEWLESWIELWDRSGNAPKLLPGYGWIFGVGDGTSNVGLGVLDTSEAFQHVDYRTLLRSWLDQTPEEWGFRDEHRTAPIRGAALPMGFNRTPHYTRGLLLVGDAGGMVNPFNGEGIAYAMEAAEMAADAIVQANARHTAAGRENALSAYPRALKDAYGGYYTLGRIFVKLIGRPDVMKALTRHALPHPTLMRYVVKMLANLTDPTGGDAVDRLVNGLNRVVPAA